MGISNYYKSSPSFTFEHLIAKINCTLAHEVKNWMIKEKFVKSNKKPVKMSNKQKCESKLSERLENDGIDYEE